MTFSKWRNLHSGVVHVARARGLAKVKALCGQSLGEVVIKRRKRKRVEKAVVNLERWRKTSSVIGICERCRPLWEAER